MQAFEEKVDDGEVENDRRKTNQRKPSGLVACPAASRRGVKIAGIKSPDDEGPHFFGVPAPEAVPGVLRPDCAGDEREAPED